MQLHHPSNVKLPPLLVDKIQEREAMESSPKIYNLLRSNLLLDKEVVALIRDIQKKSDEIDRLMKSFTEDTQSLRLHLVHAKGRLTVPGDPRMFRRWMISRSRSKSRRGHYPISQKEMEKLLAQYRSDIFKRTVSAIKRRSGDIQKLLSRFEQSRRTTLDILSSVTLFVCRKCHNLASVDRFQIATCPCGAKISTPSNIRREPIAYFDARTRNFIDNNFWFEYGVDYLLRRKNFQTLCGVQVLGHSGCSHEIDNIAESKGSNFRIFCECKTVEIRTSDVFVFAGKMTDIGCSRGYMFTLTPEPPKEIVHLARSRNISIISRVLEKKIEDLIKEIREE